MSGEGSPLWPDHQLSTGADDDPAEAHHGALVGRVEHAQRVDGVAEPLRAGGRVGSRGKHVEDAAAQRELARLLDQRLPRIAQLGQPRGHRDWIRSRARLELDRASREVGRQDGRPQSGAPRRNNDRRLAAGSGQRRERLEAQAHRLVEGRRPVEERHRHLRENVNRRPAGEPRTQVAREPLGRRNQHEQRAPARGQVARDRRRDDRPRSAWHAPDPHARIRTLEPASQRRRGIDRRLPQGGHRGSSQPKAPARLYLSAARSSPDSSASSSASATPETTFSNFADSAFVNRPST